MNSAHQTVLLEEAVAALALRPDSVVVDATLGAGGHSRLIADTLGKSGRLIAFDADPRALQLAEEKLAEVKPAVKLVKTNFSQLSQILESLQIKQVDGILADLGWRTDQFLELGRGFSFQDEADLLMTYGDPDDYLFTAKEIVNTWDEENLADIIFAYGEEKAARRIAKAIVRERMVRPFTSAKELATCIAQVVNPQNRHQRIHPATKTFQALRITVNDELQVLAQFIDQAVAALKPGGRLVIITFHSLEDRIVKHRFRELVNLNLGTVLRKKPLVPSPAEIAHNPRARSAKMRTFQKLLT